MWLGRRTRFAWICLSLVFFGACTDRAAPPRQLHRRVPPFPRPRSGPWDATCRSVPWHGSPFSQLDGFLLPTGRLLSRALISRSIATPAARSRATQWVFRRRLAAGDYRVAVGVGTVSDVPSIGPDGQSSIVLIRNNIACTHDFTVPAAAMSVVITGAYDAPCAIAISTSAEP